MDIQPWQQPDIVEHSRLLNDSFHHWTGRTLLEEVVPKEALARALYQASFVLVSHGIEADPLFNYANRAAQGLWELDWEGFVGLPSRRSAEDQAQSDRTAALSSALSQGWMEGYSGIRIAAGGQRFRIYDGVIWNLLDTHGVMRGQAATFSRWEFI